MDCDNVKKFSNVKTDLHYWVREQTRKMVFESSEALCRLFVKRRKNELIYGFEG